MDFEERLKRKNEFDGYLIFGGRDFTLKTGRDNYLNSASTPFINEETGLLRGEASRFRPCPLCDSDSTEPVFVKEGFSHVRCQECGFFFVNPILKDEYVKGYYKKKRSWYGVIRNELQVKLDRLKFNYGLDLLAHLGLTPPARLLDVGAGLGLFLAVASERGFDVSAVEIDEDFVAELRAKGFTVVDRPLRRKEPDLGPFHCITMWELLEHLRDPQETLTAAHKLLEPGGFLYVVVPNLLSLSSRILKEKSILFAGHSHINFFTRESLGRLLDQAGFEPVDWETMYTEIGLINNYLNFQDPYLGEGEEVIDFLTSEYVHERLLGSRLACVAKKS